MRSGRLFIDVYKRQAFQEHDVTMMFFMLTNIIDERTELICYGGSSKELAAEAFGLAGDTDSMMPVSYTHLDVYKRQGNGSECGDRDRQYETEPGTDRSRKQQETGRNAERDAGSAGGGGDPGDTDRIFSLIKGVGFATIFI